MRDRTGANSHVSRGQQLPNELKRGTFLTQFNDALLEREQLHVTFRGMRRESACSLVEPERLRGDIDWFVHSLI